MSRMSTSGWPVGTGTADAAGRVPPWSVADPGPGDRSGWPELEELEKDNPQEPRPGGRRADPPAPGRWAPGGHQRPEELPRPSRVSLERVSSYDPKAAEPHRCNGGWR